MKLTKQCNLHFWIILGAKNHDYTVVIATRAIMDYEAATTEL